MKQYQKVRSVQQPEPKVIDDFSVWVAENITPVSEPGTDEQPGFEGYEYDLTQYTMSVDRGNEKISYLYSTFNPAVLRSIRNIIKCGREAGIMVGMCGEAASDPLMIPLLLAFGLNEFSMSASAILKSRKMITGYSSEELQAVADKAMSFVTAQEGEAYMKEFVNQ